MSNGDFVTKIVEQFIANDDLIYMQLATEIINDLPECEQTKVMTDAKLMTLTKMQIKKGVRRWHVKAKSRY